MRKITTDERFLKLCEENKTIFIIIDLRNYYVIPEYNFNEKSFHKFINTGQIHSVSMIFHPTGKNTYDVFYINSYYPPYDTFPSESAKTFDKPCVILARHLCPY